ncbi:uncharacterized protein Tco025E_06902 [Trypanosoma conorhini]|uniref:Uncharacterized protein n=1 Tax=Trypanosoma conorhini TaxID=83891 RepID=A0A422NXB0_9TRYP|nr:uncharacterized protein Tco025E_06902 [Trypanosoma conorhini]RNF10071.1 hypothetical protein Tco025E_06902 [Trypanosoma conorhini]
MLSTLRPEGAPAMPLAAAGLRGTPVRCGGVDLRAWAVGHVGGPTSSFAAADASAVPPSHEATRGQSRGQPIPVWAVVSLVLLGTLGAACVAGIAFLARGLRLQRAPRLSRRAASQVPTAAREQRAHSSAGDLQRVVCATANA